MSVAAVSGRLFLAETAHMAAGPKSAQASPTGFSRCFCRRRTTSCSADRIEHAILPEQPVSGDRAALRTCHSSSYICDSFAPGFWCFVCLRRATGDDGCRSERGFGERFPAALIRLDYAAAAPAQLSYTKPATGHASRDMNCTNETSIEKHVEC